MGDNVQDYVVAQEDLRFQVAQQRMKLQQSKLEYRQNERRQEKVKVNMAAHVRAIAEFERALAINVAEHGEAPELDIDLSDVEDGGGEGGAE